MQKSLRMSLGLLIAFPAVVACQDQEADGRPRGFPDADVYVQGFLDGTQPRAPAVAVWVCPSDSEWHGQVLEGLLAINLSQLSDEQILSFSVSWTEGIRRCGFPLYQEWYERALPGASDRITVQQLARGMLIERAPERVEALIRYGLDETKDGPARTAALTEVSVGYDAQQHADLLLALLARGDVPDEFMGHAVGTQLMGPDLDRFTRRVLDVEMADPAGRNAATLWVNIASSAAQGRMSRGTAEAVLNRLDSLAAIPGAHEGIRDAPDTWGAQIRARIRS